MPHTNWLDQTIQMAIDNVNAGKGPFAVIAVKDGGVIGRGTIFFIFVI